MPDAARLAPTTRQCSCIKVNVFMPVPVKKVLIANRGEIAVRIAATVRALGMQSVAIYSDADRTALHVQHADAAYRIGAAAAKDSYLCAERIVELAQQVGADAIHPGYGFLAENAAFAAAVAQAGLCFVGPSAAAIAAMGDKAQARAVMEAAGVPTVPGGLVGASVETAAALAQALGYPVMLKAAAGGGGKGMRRVEAPDGLGSALRAARSEAQSAFGDPTVYMEKYLDDPRHIEVQIFGDVDGTIWILGERECSLQRRHQKVVEESPCAWLPEALRQHLFAVARQAGEAVDYRGAGTVEFLVDATGHGYFLEMNTRLQVEHAVTEACFGVDMVAAQLRVASGTPLGWDPATLRSRGHAIEVRLYAEDPEHDFMPSPGHLEALHLPDGAGIRVDRGVEAPCDVSPHYDPLLCKIIAYGEDRAQACGRLRQALRQTRVLGLKTNLDFLRQLIDRAFFVAGTYHTGSIALHPSRGAQPLSEAELDLATVAAALATFRYAARQAPPVHLQQAEQAAQLAWQQAMRPMGLA
jgi:acetyl/propionyl-CoA carboxylase alpha subunit